MRRRSFYALAALAGLALFTLPTWLPSTTGESWANDSTPSAAKTEAAGTTGDANAVSPAVEPNVGVIYDRAFDKYVDSDFVAAAWNRLDADALTDAALQLAEGERILLRSHKLGSAADVLRLASRIATSRGNKETLARITMAAKALKVEDVANQVAVAEKLGGASRADSAAATVQIDEVTPVQFAMYRDLVNAIRRASLRGDRKSLETAQQSVDKMARLTEKQRTNLKQVFEEAIKTTPAAATAGDSVASKLSKLQGASRNDDEILNIVGRVIRAVDTVVNDDFGQGHGHGHGRGGRGHGQTRGHNHGQGGTWTYYYDEDDGEYYDDEEWYDEEDEEWYDEDYEDEDADWNGGGHGHGHGRRVIIGHGHGHGHGQGNFGSRRAPSWLVGKWQVENRALGAPKEVYTFASDFTYTKASTPNAYRARTTRTGPFVFAWANGRLTMGTTSYTVASSGARMTLTTRGRTVTLFRVP
jgi:hypothetical protein